jgi:hypothetical protein
LVVSSNGRVTGKRTFAAMWIALSTSASFEKGQFSNLLDRPDVQEMASGSAVTYIP